MSLKRRLALSFALLLVLGLVNIVTHTWGSSVRSELFSELQVVMRDQAGVRDLEQKLDAMHKKVRVIQTLVEAGNAQPVTEAEAIEQINTLNTMLSRADMLALRAQEVLDTPIDFSASRNLLNNWSNYLSQFAGGQAESVVLEDTTPVFRAAMQSLVTYELALVERSSRINEELNSAVETTNRMTTLIFLATLLATVLLAWHIVTFTSRSIRALHQGTQQWGNGNLAYQVPPLEGELGELAENFNHMARNLRVAMNEVKAASARADAANQAKSSFLANMSHELRTPMNAIIGYSEMLIEEAGDDPTQEVGDFVPDVEKVLSAGQHLLALINDVLDISKIESGKMTVFREVTDLSQLLNEVIVTVQPMIDKNGNKLNYTNELADSRTATDVTRFRQIVLNLLSNAAKFTREGEVSLTVREAIHGGDAFIEVAVQDTGIGMSEEQMAQVFEAFIQADLSTTKEYGGTGLGLTISKKFAELLGGSIEVESELGKGSCFTLRLPKLTEGAEKGVDQSNGGPSPETVQVLMVDDNAEARDICSRHLSQAGYRVTCAESGSKALSLLDEVEPDLILLDVMMPEMDGWQFIEALRQRPASVDTPVVIQSMVNEREMGDLMKVSAYLVKPVDKQALVTTINQVLGIAAEELCSE
ncbi:signal transduction histidine kinase/ActR/RegA family two-component response regulator [Litorivivens lipolytica]|uniref:histidine kinase n=1 Tax=Litorivivens lipolytica TaxID=1524264 RepID=A0A7W4W5Z5_9GAMM|nr:ATP-binding protein [Litorivivens lipolytica]MBB3048116.1 signal transduction histidine kinase/ActR/RegA family two-component response regulator [Litorivivens lipolytica]